MLGVAVNPAIIALARVRYLAQGGAPEQAGADAVCYDEAGAATALATVLRVHFKAAKPAVDRGAAQTP